ncbi:MAG: helicase-related protein [Kiritimatiellae bacterium]|nr:helicase-related protein [Kiritimatiellia bacterium]
MPRIFDNIEQSLLPALQETMRLCSRADFCVGYLNLRGWKQLDACIEKWSGGDGNCCRLLIGMQTFPEDELRSCLGLTGGAVRIDNATAIRLKKRLAEEFRNQLCIGAPTNEDEEGLRRLARQIKAKKVIVKLFLQYPLHAKLYLLFRSDPVNPAVGYLGSSNLTLAGLSRQGELNIDVLDHDACAKLADWFNERWNDQWCLDISRELIEIIETSWAREKTIPPYHIYLKIAYSLAQEARAGLAEFKIPKEFGDMLFEFQKAAVKIAAHHLNKRGGVLIGDVVGLGKTLMATVLARIFEEDHGLETLVICPKNLVRMWEDYRHQYGLRARVMSLSQAVAELPDTKRYRLVIIDESHNLRNREGKRYKAIQNYLKENESKVILLTATPYNKTYLDLANQLRLFVSEEEDIGIRPERLLKDIGETEFIRRHQCPARSLAAFEKSEYPDDWRELMRLYLVRRTRSFIQENYAERDPMRKQKYLVFADGNRSYFPTRIPKTLKFATNGNNPDDQYGRLYSEDVVKIINRLELPRYGLGNYIAPIPHSPPTPQEAKQIADLSRGGKRLKGFCRTGLFKRLESGGYVFLQSLERHILRNYVYLHAIENNLPVPIGAQDIEMLDSRFSDEDADDPNASINFDDEKEENDSGRNNRLRTSDEFKARAGEIYDFYRKHCERRFKWLRAGLFGADLPKDLLSDAKNLMKILRNAGDWDPSGDAKLIALAQMLQKKHPADKVLIFTQFADTAVYLEERLRAMNIPVVASATGNSSDPTLLAWRFSPVSNDKRARVSPSDELRVLIATDVLSEGQNLQDAHIVVNYDLPWAIIRLIQRAGRVDRIGQKADSILCYSFLPAEGVEKIIQLRSRVRQRLRENAEVVGADESFFEDQMDEQTILNLYNEKAGILDGEADNEVDLSSYAYQIWKNAVDKNPELEKIVSELPPVVYSTRPWEASPDKPEGVLVYLKTAEGNDALAWLDKDGNSVTESQYAILQAAECNPNTPALPKQSNHHDLVEKGVKLIVEEERTVGGQLGRPTGARFRAYERLKHYVEDIKGELFDTTALRKAVEQIYRHPLRQTATDTLNRQLKSGIGNEALAELVVALHEEDRLCIVQEAGESREPKIICSLGLKNDSDIPPPVKGKKPVDPQWIVRTIREARDGNH